MGEELGNFLIPLTMHPHIARRHENPGLAYNAFPIDIVRVLVYVLP